MTLDADRPVSRRARFLYPGFIASLAFNLLFVGGIAAAAWHHHSSKPDGYGMMTFAQELQPEHREAFRESIRETRAKVKDLRNGVRQKWLDANALLTAEPFDKERFRAALTDLRDAENQFRTVLNNSLAEKAAKFSPEERKALQAWREKRHQRFLLKHSKKPGDKSAS